MLLLDGNSDSDSHLATLYTSALIPPPLKHKEDILSCFIPYLIKFIMKEIIFTLRQIYPAFSELRY